MLKPIRKTLNGNTEYWDTKEQRIVIGESPKEKQKENTDQPFGVHDGENNYQLNDMTIKELKEFAEKHTIDLPSELTKKGDIAKFIFDNWNTVADAE